MDGKADLHMHTTYSDGALLPHEVVVKAKGAGLRTISITDHDTVGRAGRIACSRQAIRYRGYSRSGTQRNAE